MKVLVLYTSEGIKAWLVNETFENVPEHIKNGYPELLPAFESKELKAEIIEVPEEDVFRADIYTIKTGIIENNATLIIEKLINI